MILFSCACYFYNPPLVDDKEKATEISSNKNNNKCFVVDEESAKEKNKRIDFFTDETVL